MSTEVLATILLIAIALVLLVARRPELGATAGGKLIIFVALFVLPVASVRTGVNTHLEGSKTTEFCMSCHVMEPYGQSLLFADAQYLPADHFQNRRIDRTTACFTCHTQYTMFGDMNAKLNGLKHLYVYYSGQTPDQIELYSPYNNRECLHCHTGARGFEELHGPDMAGLVNNEFSCMACHGRAHDVHDLAGASLWMDSLDAALQGGPLE